MLISSCDLSISCRASGCHTSFCWKCVSARSCLCSRGVAAGGIPDSLRRAEFWVVTQAGSAALTAFRIFLSSRFISQPASVTTFLSRWVVMWDRPDLHVSAPYSALLRIQAFTALIISTGAMPRWTIWIQRKNCVGRCAFSHHSCTCCLNFIWGSSYTSIHLTRRDGEILRILI